MIDQFPNLTQFFSSYFHQDWPLEADTPSQAVNNYLNSEPPESIEAASQELAQLLEMPISEPDLETFILDELGCYYDAQSENQTVREWLESVQKSLTDRS
ncbi:MULTISPECIES: contact-dependent growth inhibition system immunity protein [unclassified Microcoleus]|uniref:contact-dependent growth inhibition system immunity protein n=1 Tax=unclassified Microcoleus TaxID=2642155 RepID=UPI0025DAB25F|nr:MULTISPECIES: contact-dependent growth inhibition system immunity protein [unclassified Microcoleus]